MAEIRVEPRKRSLTWLWLLLLVAVAAAVAWYFMNGGSADVGTTTGSAEIGSPLEAVVAFADAPAPAPTSIS